MSNKHKLYWSTDGRNFHLAQDIEYLLAKQKQEIEDCDAQTALVVAHTSAAEWFLDIRQDLKKFFRKYVDAFANSHRRKIFKSMLQKVFTGETWEQKVLKALRFDLIILCCFVLDPDQFEKVKKLGLQDVFAKQVNKDFEDRDPLIPVWIAKTSKAIAEDSSLLENAAAKIFAQALRSFLSPPILSKPQLFFGFVEEGIAEDELLENPAQDIHLEPTQDSGQPRATAPNCTLSGSAILPPEPALHAQTEENYHGVVMPLSLTHPQYSQFHGVNWAGGTVAVNSQSLHPAESSQQSITVSHRTSVFPRSAQDNSTTGPPKNGPFRIMTKENIENGDHTPLKRNRGQGGRGSQGKRRKRNAVSGSTRQDHNATPATQQISWNETYRPQTLEFEGVNRAILSGTGLPSESYLADNGSDQIIDIMGDFNTDWQPFILPTQL